MIQDLQRTKVLVEALPYIQLFKGKIVVVKYGGAAMAGDHDLESILKDITLLKYVGMQPILVHGGGPAVNQALDSLGISPNFHNGLRITDKETMNTAQMVLIGQVNTNLVSALDKLGAKALGLSGCDGQLIKVKKSPKIDDVDLGYVGEITNINTDLINSILDLDYIPVIAPIGINDKGENFNINADTVAAKVAAAMEAEKIIFLTDIDGIRMNKDEPNSLLHTVSSEKAVDLITNKVVVGGMVPKVNACLSALENGVSRAHIINGKTAHSILLEIFTDLGIGTMVTK